MCGACVWCMCGCMCGVCIWCMVGVTKCVVYLVYVWGVDVVGDIEGKEKSVPM